MDLKSVAAALVAGLLAALVGLDSGRQSELADIEAAIKLPQGRCYALVSDFLTYNKWQPAIVDVESLALPGITEIGSSFTLYYRMPLWGAVPYTQIVSYVEEGKEFAYESDGLMRIRTNLRVRTKSDKVCYIRVQLGSGRSSLLFYIHPNPKLQYLLRPVMGFYYQNWATQSLINVKMNNMHNF